MTCCARSWIWVPGERMVNPLRAAAVRACAGPGLGWVLCGPSGRDGVGAEAGGSGWPVVMLCYVMLCSAPCAGGGNDRVPHRIPDMLHRRVPGRQWDVGITLTEPRKLAALCWRQSWRAPRSPRASACFTSLRPPICSWCSAMDTLTHLRHTHLRMPPLDGRAAQRVISIKQALHQLPKATAMRLSRAVWSEWMTLLPDSRSKSLMYYT